VSSWKRRGLPRNFLNGRAFPDREGNCDHLPARDPVTNFHKELWLVPFLPLLAAGVISVSPRRQRKLASTAAIGSMVVSFLLSCVALVETLSQRGAGEVVRQATSFRWLQFGDQWIQLGWVLDPLTAVMLVMVSFVGLLIFIYSTGYMAHDENFTCFFCFLSLFAAAMLGLVISNSLLLLFICWELVGLTSYLLIGFWYHKPAAAAAARKAFITTRLGDLAFLLGIVFLYSRTGTLLFYDSGNGCLESSALTGLAGQLTRWGITASAAIALLIFCGAIGKSGQVPLHVWLPDAMEGPTPVSALIHAATMVAAGVFLVARMYPLFAIGGTGGAGTTISLQAVTWVGSITAVFAATIAVAQADIKRILAYSTVSQLGFMMMGLGMGGVAVGMFHLLTHAFFKALLFLGAGSVIHGCHEEQDVRCMGGLRKFMPITFLTYAVGMMALSGVPIFFSGFWSKDGILHSAHEWSLSRWPFYLGVAGAFLTAFYMTRQVVLVFFGNCQLAFGRTTASEQRTVEHGAVAGSATTRAHAQADSPHESPKAMVVPLVVLAVFSIVLGFIGTPIWPWFQSFISGTPPELNWHGLSEPGVPFTFGLSTAIALGGIVLAWFLYSGRPAGIEEPDVLEHYWPNTFALWRRKYFIDEAYQWAVVGLTRRCAQACDWLDRWVCGAAVQLLSWIVVGWSWLDRIFDERVINSSFDESCERLTQTGGMFSQLQNGRVQLYLRMIALGFLVLAIVSIWGCRAQ
jgi:NADH-quinone oxidoreductase subunit L